MRQLQRCAQVLQRRRRSRERSEACVDRRVVAVVTASLRATRQRTRPRAADARCVCEPCPSTCPGFAIVLLSRSGTAAAEHRDSCCSARATESETALAAAACAFNGVAAPHSATPRHARSLPQQPQQRSGGRSGDRMGCTLSCRSRSQGLLATIDLKIPRPGPCLPTSYCG